MANGFDGFYPVICRVLYPFQTTLHERLIGFNSTSGFVLTFYKRLSLQHENERSSFKQKCFTQFIC